MVLVKDYLKYLLSFTTIIAIGLTGICVLFYLLGCFIEWEWLPLPSADKLNIEMVDVRIGILSFLITSIVFYNLPKDGIGPH